MDAKISNSDEMKNVYNTVIEQFQTQHFRKILPIIFRRSDMYLIGNRCTQSISPVLIEKFTVPLYNSYSL